ncbi:MAG: methylcrotonoyl-CoA carboxylase, partial [Candidatus Eisenbacteria bacterium]|nr:methylcrotonoyl-CoA carboxylase [Candidatus Eisenbacteria bacterium]
MEILESTIDPSSQAYRENHKRLANLVAELQKYTAEARLGGPEKSQKRHRDQGKLFVRDRIEHLLDPHTAFLELGTLAAHGLYEGSAPGAGIVTGIGQVSGQ